MSDELRRRLRVKAPISGSPSSKFTPGRIYLTAGLFGYDTDLLFQSDDAGATWSKPTRSVSGTVSGSTGTVVQSVEQPVPSVLSVLGNVKPMWTQPVRVGGFGARADPVVMTTTSNGRLFLVKRVFDADGQSIPGLYWLNDDGTMSGPVDVRYNEPNPLDAQYGVIDKGKIGAGMGNVNLTGQAAISRMPGMSPMPGSYLRVAYPSIIGYGTAAERQVIRVVYVTVWWPDDYGVESIDCPAPNPVGGCRWIDYTGYSGAGVRPPTIHVCNGPIIDEGAAVDADGYVTRWHALQARFIEMDRMEYPGLTGDPNNDYVLETLGNFAVLTWFKWQGSDLSLTPEVAGAMRYMVFATAGATAHNAPATLAQWTNTGYDPGDYSYGGFYLENPQAGTGSPKKFLVVWSQPSTEGGTDARAFFSVITVSG